MDKNGKTGRRYSVEEKAAAVRMVRTLRAELGANRGLPDQRCTSANGFKPQDWEAQQRPQLTEREPSLTREA